MVFKRIRSNHQVAIFYDAMGRDFHVREHAQAQAGMMWAGRNSRASYDLAGRPVWRAVSSQTTTTDTFDDSLLRDVRDYDYDSAGRLVSDRWRPEGPAGMSFTVGYGYDPAGNRTSIVWPPVGSTTFAATYAFDAANRVQSATFPGAGGSQTVAITHDSLSRRTGINRPGLAADTTYAYEPDSDLATLSHGFVAGTGPGATQFSYGHDAAGKATSIAINQPMFEWMPTMAYARTYGAANVMNQLPSENGVPITWSGAGDMTSDGVNTYVYTYGHRLVQATRTGMTATYDYDSDDRRTKKIVNGVMTRTIWSGADELAQLDVNGEVIRHFIPDGTGAMDARLATVEGNGDLYWHHTDHQGSVIATSRPDGTTAGVATYSPHGEFGTGQSVPPLGSPFGYTGRQYDAETGLYQYRARYYSPRLDQFLTQDPIGTKDDPNLYLYVGADPVNATDPTGMCPRCVVSGYRILKRTVQSRGNVGRAIREEGASFVENGSTLLDGQLTSADAFAVIDLGTGLGSEARTISSFLRGERRIGAGDHARRQGAREGVIDRPGAAERRRENLRGEDTAPGMDRDEYPPAVVRPTDGGGVSVERIPSSENRSSGGVLRDEISDLPDGTRVRIEPPER